MNLQAQLSGREHQISLNVEGGVVSAEVDGREYQIQVSGSASDAAGEYVLLYDSHVYKCRVERKRDSSHTANVFAVSLRGVSHDVTIIDPKRLRSAHAAASHDHGEVEIVSPMPGKIVRVLVEAGAKVEAGAGIVIVEAMKMQNELKSPKAGLVVSINTQAGATVSAGDVLATIE